MSDPDNFLARWSRRKRAAADNDAEATSASPPSEVVGEGPARDDDQKNTSVATTVPVEPVEPPFDLTRLPTLESITAESDIRAFLAPGVPPDLTRAALRRVWVADPKIRNFVGLADYDWDYHAPGSMAGFGPLEMTDELRRLVARIVGGDVPQDPAHGGAHAPVSTSGPETPVQTTIESGGTAVGQAGSPEQVEAKQLGVFQEEDVKYNPEQRSHKEVAQYDKESAAPQHELEKPDNLPSIVRRPHGRALPK